MKEKDGKAGKGRERQVKREKGDRANGGALSESAAISDLDGVVRVAEEVASSFVSRSVKRSGRRGRARAGRCSQTEWTALSEVHLLVRILAVCFCRLHLRSPLELAQIRSGDARGSSLRISYTSFTVSLWEGSWQFGLLV